MRRKRKYFSLLFNNRNYMGESQVGDKGGELNRWEQYWAARSLSIIAENQESSMEQFIDATNKFIEIVDNDVRNLTKFEPSKDTKYEIDKDQIINDVLSRRSAAFHLLWVVSFDLCCKKNHMSESLKFALRAADQLSGSISGCAIDINSRKYIEFLEHLNFLLRDAPEKDRSFSKVSSIMEKIEDHNKNTKDQEIADFAMLIRSFYGDAKTIRSVKKAKFNLIYSLKVADDSGLKFLSIESPKYLLGREKISIDGRKEYIYEKLILINSDTVFNEKPYFRVVCEDIYGNVSRSELFPVIKMIK